MPLVSFPITKLQNTNPIFLQTRLDLSPLKTSLGGVNSHYGLLFSLHCFVHSALTFPDIPKTKHRDFLSQGCSSCERPLHKITLVHCPSNDLNPDRAANSIPRTLTIRCCQFVPPPFFFFFIQWYLIWNRVTRKWAETSRIYFNKGIRWHWNFSPRGKETMAFHSHTLKVISKQSAII